MMFQGRCFRLLTGALGACALVTLLGATASAQYVTDTFEPTVSNEVNVLNVMSSDLLPHLHPSFAIVPTYLDTPLELPGPDGESIVLLDSAFRTDITAGLGLFDYVEIGFGIPMMLYQDGPSLAQFGLQQIEGFAAGDLKMTVKARVLRPEWASGLGVALSANIYAPTGDQDSFLSDGDWRVEPRLALDYRHRSGFQISTNFAAHFRPRRTFLTNVSDRVIRWGAGVVIPSGFLDNLEIIATVTGDHNTADVIDPEDPDMKRTLDEGEEARIAVNGMVKASFDKFHVQVGAGGVVSSELGPSNLHFMMSTGYATEEADRDSDGIFDGADQCPLEAEDADGFEDSDGCPDLDNDKDGVLDAADKCPTEAEDADQWQDEDGCPDNDNDADGFADAEDKCPSKAEDKDGFEDSDGCPEDDNDKDGIADAKDKCPNKPETVNKYQDEDGCPDWKLRLDDVKFASGRAKILAGSHGALDDAVNQIGKLAPGAKLRVEGHTDSNGSAKANQKLSTARAEAVRKYLVTKGVPAARLVAKGFGEDKPTASNKTKAGRAENRRVVIVLVEEDGD